MPALADGVKHCEAACVPEPEFEPHDPVFRKWKLLLPEKLKQIFPPELWRFPLGPSLPPLPPLPDAGEGPGAGEELAAGGGAGAGEELAAACCAGCSATFSWTGAGEAPAPAVTVTMVVAESQTVTTWARTLAGPAMARRESDRAVLDSILARPLLDLRCCVESLREILCLTGTDLYVYKWTGKSLSWLRISNE